MTQTQTTWSPQQQRIFDWFRAPQPPPSQHGVVIARAGTGKTTTIIEGTKHAPEKRGLLAAFNKSIATELQDRLTNPSFAAMTLHSVGFRLVKLQWANVRMNTASGKLSRGYKATREVMGDQAPEPIVWLVTKLHSKGREVMPEAQSGELVDLAEHFDLLPDREWEQEGWDVQRIADLALQVMDHCAKTQPIDGIDFADMLFLPVRNHWCVPTYDIVVVDEAQDMNPAQLQLAQGVLKPGGRMLLVGDDRQAIYGFRGADSEALGRLGAELGATFLGLTTTYRCPKSVVQEANRLVEDFKAADTNPEGLVRTITTDKLMGTVQPGDFLLSRSNAPLISTALQLLASGVRARIQGRDIGAGLRKLLDQLATGKASDSIPELLSKLQAWEQREVERAERQDLQTQADKAMDQAATLRALIAGAKGVPEVRRRLDDLFTEDGRPSVLCSSIHRAKGLEARHVFVLKDTLFPPPPCQCGHRHPWGKCNRCGCEDYEPDQRVAREEQNIAYVAITRAKEELVWVEGEE